MDDYQQNNPGAGEQQSHGMQENNPPSPLQLRAGNIIANRYEIVNKLGAGGMGAVYKVYDKALENEVVALKLLFPEHVQDQTTFARFRNEVLVARKLAHPNVTRLYDFGEDGLGAAFLTMEYVEGKSLGGLIYAPRHERLVFEEVVDILYQVVDGTSHAHQHGIIHRDLKPDNILITSGNQAKVTDFGLARSLEVDKGLTLTGEAVGTPYYMSPEQLRGVKLDERTDIYSFGIIAFEAAAGQRPFQEETYLRLAALHMQAPMPSLLEVNPGIPAWYDEMVQICGEKKKEDRFQSMAEVAEFIRENRGELGSNTISKPAMSQALAAKNSKKQYRGRGRSLKERRKRNKIILFSSVIFSVIFLLSMFRFNGALNSASKAFVLKTEKSSGLNLSFIKSFLGSSISLNQDELLKAAKDERFEDMEMLLSSGVNANIQEENGQSLLMNLLSEGKTEPAKILVKNGASVDKTNFEGLTPLMLASLNAEPELVSLLISSGADVNTENDEGETALLYAVKTSNTQIVSKLISAGASAKVEDINQDTALIHAVKQDNYAISKLLVEASADLNKKDKEGLTSLMHSVKGENVELVRLLVESGADETLRDQRGRVASELATDKNKIVLQKSLEKRASSVSKKTKFIKTSDGIFTSKGSNKEEKEPEVEEEVIESGPEMTRLRLVGKVQSLYKFSSKIGLESLEAEISNKGEVEAQNVEVRVEIPGGKEILLSGPQSLARKKKHKYTWQGFEDVTSSYHKAKKKLKSTISCSNCR